MGAVVTLAIVASPVYAQNLTVNFIPNPLFGEVNFLPGDMETGDATVTNGTDVMQSIYAESVNGFDPDNLGSQLYLRVFESSIVVYENEFDDFLSAGPVSLSSLPAGDSTTYTFEVSFIDSADNDYMGKSLGFDLCIGFSGGTLQCGGTVISDSENSIPPDGDGGGGGSGQFLTLIIFNENALVTFAGTPVGTPDGTATVTWNTNFLSTSQVVYGLASGGPYPVDLGAINFGYPLGTAEDPLKATNHSVPLSGLTEGQTYVYRVVSRASPPTVSVEHTFTMPTTGAGNFIVAQAESNSVASIGEGSGDVDVVETPETEATFTVGTEAEAEDNSNLLAFALGGLNFGLSGLICVGVALLIFLAFLGLIWLVSKNKKDKSLSRNIKLLVVSGLVVSLILWLILYTCPIIPLWVIIAIYTIWRFFNREDK